MDVDPTNPTPTKPTPEASPAPVPEPAAPAPAPLVSKEESLLKSAGEGVDEVDDQPSRVVVPGQPPKPSHKKRNLIICLVLFLVAAFVVGYLFVFGKKDDAKDNSATQQTQVTETKSIGYTADKVNYQFRATSSAPFSIYNRPAAGGERKEAQKLTTDESVSSYSTVGQHQAFLANYKKIYLSNDGGLTYKAIYEADATEDVISVYLSDDATQLAYSTVTTDGDLKSSIYTVNLDGSSKKKITSATEKAFLLLGFSQAKQKLAYSEGCWGCDGARSGYKLYDMKAKEATNLFGDISIKTLSETLENMAISPDLSTMIYILSTVPANPQTEGPGTIGTAPYKVKTVNLATTKTTDVDTVGTSGEKNSNGTLKRRNFNIGFLAGNATPYFAEGKTVTKVVSGEPKLAYSADANIVSVSYLSDDNIIVSTGEINSDFTLSNYTFATKKSVQIFVGDSNTTIIGVTTK